MKSITEYFDELKAKTGSDYKSAILMEMDRATLSYMRKRGQIADETALKLAKALGKDETELLIAASAARSKDDVRRAWEKVSRMAGYLALVFCVFSGSYIDESHYEASHNA